MPDSLYEALFARLRSGAGAVNVVEAAAIVGSRIERGLLLSALDLPEAELDPVLASGECSRPGSARARTVAAFVMSYSAK